MRKSPIRQVRSSYTYGQRNKAAGGVCDGMYNPVADKSQTLDLQFDRQTDWPMVVPEILRSNYSAQGDHRAWPLVGYARYRRREWGSQLELDKKCLVSQDA